MPYSKISELPSAVKNSLPASAQKIWMDAYNAAHNNPKISNKYAYAWGAVERRFKKSKDGKWTQLSDKDTALNLAAEGILDLFKKTNG